MAINQYRRRGIKTGTYDFDDGLKLKEAVLKMGANSVNIYIEKYCSVPADAKQPSRSRRRR
jgi:hypothetical protein